MNEPIIEVVIRCECGEMMLVGQNRLYCPLCHGEERINAQKDTYARTYAFETMLVSGAYLGDRSYGYAGQMLKAIAVNLGHTNSKVFDSVWDESKYDLMISFVRRPDKLWNVSLYSTKEDIDCGVIAMSFGGGGHKGAAEFQCADLPFVY